jgi:hypothetical protein
MTCFDSYVLETFTGVKQLTAAYNKYPLCFALVAVPQQFTFSCDRFIPGTTYSNTDSDGDYKTSVFNRDRTDASDQDHSDSLHVSCGHKRNMQAGTPQGMLN